MKCNVRLSVSNDVQVIYISYNILFLLLVSFIYWLFILKMFFSLCCVVCVDFGAFEIFCTQFLTITGTQHISCNPEVFFFHHTLISQA